MVKMDRKTGLGLQQCVEATSGVDRTSKYEGGKNARMVPLEQRTRKKMVDKIHRQQMTVRKDDASGAQNKK